MKNFDVAIVGGGVVGSAIARELSKYNVNVAVFEKGSDVASATSKANSGVIHSGINSSPGSLKARFCVEGNQLIQKLANDLDFPVKWVGKLVIAKNDEEIKELEKSINQIFQKKEISDDIEKFERKLQNSFDEIESSIKTENLEIIDQVFKNQIIDFTGLSELQFYFLVSVFAGKMLENFFAAIFMAFNRRILASWFLLITAGLSVLYIVFLCLFSGVTIERVFVMFLIAPVVCFGLFAPKIEYKKIFPLFFDKIYFGIFEFRTIGADVCSGDDDFFKSGIGKLPGFPEHESDFPAARFASYVRHYAE